MDGILGLIIIFVVINVASRLLKSVTGGNKKGDSKGKSPIQALIAELREESVRHVLPEESSDLPGEFQPAAGDIDLVDESADVHGEKESAVWGEDQFESAGEWISPLSSQIQTDLPEIPGVEPTPAKPYRVESAEVHTDGLSEKLDRLPYMQRAFVLTAVLGRCRAMEPHGIRSIR